MIKVLYFSTLRESFGVAHEDIDLPSGISDVATLRAYLAKRGKQWELLAHAANLRTAVNQEMADESNLVADGDEIAFFPPVTGG